MLPSNRYVISFLPPSGTGWSVAVCEHNGTQKHGNDLNCNNMSIVVSVSNTCCVLQMFDKPINIIFPIIRNIVPNANTHILPVSRLILKVCLIFRAYRLEVLSNVDRYYDRCQLIEFSDIFP